jgi:hypothetical protein
MAGSNESANDSLSCSLVSILLTMNKAVDGAVINYYIHVTNLY